MPKDGHRRAARDARRQATSLIILSLLILAGCNGSSASSDDSSGGGSASLAGSVQGGLAPITGAAVTLYAAGNAYGANPTVLGRATTGAEGKFTIAYKPPSPAAVLYAVVLGGDSGDGPNSAIGLLGVAGLSGTLPQSVTVNELTTISAAWSLAQFTDATGGLIGAPASNSSGFINAVLQVQANLTDIASGGPADFWSTYGVNAESCASSPPVNCDGLERMDTLANILSSCVVSSGPASSECSQLLALTGSSNTTLQAAHYIATHPTTQPADLFLLQGDSTSPFTPALAAAPSDGWEIALNLNPGGANFSSPRFVAIDASGNVWVSVDGTNSVTELTTSGALIGNFAPTGANFDTPRGLAIDSTGDVWVVNFFGNSATELNSSGGLVGNYNPDGANFANPTDLTIDLTGNVWISNFGEGSVTELDDNGGLIGNYNPSSIIGGPQGITTDAAGNAWMDNDGSVIELTSEGALAGNYDPASSDISGAVAVAIDAAGHAWIANSTGNSVTELTSSGALVGNYDPTGANFSSPYFVAIYGTGGVWIANSDGNSVTELTSAGALAGNFAPAGASFSRPIGTAIDASGNVWIANNDGNTVTEIIGAAGPVLTPVVACLEQSPPHAVCLP